MKSLTKKKIHYYYYYLPITVASFTFDTILTGKIKIKITKTFCFYLKLIIIMF